MPIPPSTPPTWKIQAIDVHAHYGAYSRPGKELPSRLMTGDAQTVVRRARAANIGTSIVSPLAALMPRSGADPVSANEDCRRVVSLFEELYQWVVVDPLSPQTFSQARQMLQTEKCVGIKIHPEEHGYEIRRHGGTLFELAAELRAVVLTHSGEQNSMPEDFRLLADDFPEVTLILGHLGCGWDDDLSHQVRAIQASRNGNIFVDTSSASNVTSGLIEWAVAEIGAERVLFGTDSPLYFAPMQRTRIDHAEVSDGDKELILRKNAERVLDLAPRTGPRRRGADRRGAVPS